MSENPRELERLREIQRRIDEMNKIEARRLRDIIQQVKDIESPQSPRKRIRRRELGETLPNGALSSLQIECIEHHCYLGLSYGEISFPRYHPSEFQTSESTLNQGLVTRESKAGFGSLLRHHAKFPSSNSSEISSLKSFLGSHSWKANTNLIWWGRAND